MAKWTTADIPDQHGKTVIVTGANSGLGFEVAAALARRGARVVLAVRNLERGQDAIKRIISSDPGADLALQRLDLSSLASVHKAADELKSNHDRVDLLVNNAGVMFPPKELTEDGFESQFGINHLGPFALTGLLLERLLPVRSSRIVTISSLGHRMGAAIHFDDLQWERKYNANGAYAQSKLANLLFTYELQRRLSASGNHAIATAAHPGFSNTDLQRHMPRPAAAVVSLMSQSAQMGALPTLRAAVDPKVSGGRYFGPRGPGGTRGYPVVAKSSKQSHDPDLQRRLWAVSEELTGVTFPV